MGVLFVYMAAYRAFDSTSIIRILVLSPIPVRPARWVWPMRQRSIRVMVVIHISVRATIVSIMGRVWVIRRLPPTITLHPGGWRGWGAIGRGVVIIVFVLESISVLFRGIFMSSLLLQILLTSVPRGASVVAMRGPIVMVIIMLMLRGGGGVMM